MPVSLYQVTVPVFIKQLGLLDRMLEKATEHATTQNTPGDQIVQSRLVADMLPMAFQVQSCSNHAKFVLARAGGMSVPSWDDNETTMAQLHERIQKTIDLLKTAKPECMDGKEDIEVVIRRPGKSYHFTTESYLLTFAIPNFYFHFTTAYAIMRSTGVEIGKWDYLGEVDTRTD